jgi:AbrB family looped-hinge helix DNA binding protein
MATADISANLAFGSSGNLSLCLLYTVRRVRSIVSMSPNGRVTLPAEARRALGLHGESLFEVHQSAGAIVLRPVAVVPLEQARSKSSRKKAN